MPCYRDDKVSCGPCRSVPPPKVAPSSTSQGRAFCSFPSTPQGRAFLSTMMSGTNWSRLARSFGIFALASKSARAFLSPLPPTHHLETATSSTATNRPQQQLRMTSSLNNASARQRAVVVGGGPAGALMAVVLSRSGRFDVDVFEAFEESKISGPTIRSWNVVLLARGSHALESTGVDLQEEVGVLVRAERRG